MRLLQDIASHEEPFGSARVNHIVNRFPARFELPWCLGREIQDFDELSLIWLDPLLDQWMG